MQTISMSLAEWQEKQHEVEELQRKLAELEKARETDRLQPGTDATQLSEALMHALPIVQFAIASCTPRMFPGWPHEHLDALAKLVAVVPGVPPGLREGTEDLRVFARDAKEWEDARKNGTHMAKFIEENSRGTFTPPEGFFEGPKI